ncbi:MAG TPA: hypothetical protein VJJ73_02505, partial [Candidatus Paceibacterota bacterium]
VIITGGTETGHSEGGPLSHGSGYKIDLKPTPELNAYITSHSIGSHNRGDAIEYIFPDGTLLARENPGVDNDHWDLTLVDKNSPPGGKSNNIDETLR